MANKIKDIPYADGASLTPSQVYELSAPISVRAPKLSPSTKQQSV
jgi:hypothetical protein